jgi:hypothetical protein
MVRVRKVFNPMIERKPYSIRSGAAVMWISEEDLISLVKQAREALPKKVQVPFSEHAMPAGKMKVMIPIV